MKLELVLLIAVVVILAVVIEVVRRRRLSESYALLWIGVAVVGSLLALARPLVDRLSNAIGIVYGTSLVFALAILFLLIVCINLSMHVSRLEQRVETLAQELALRDVQGGDPGPGRPRRRRPDRRRRRRDRRPRSGSARRGSRPPVVSRLDPEPAGLADALALMADARSVAVLTGAGISTDSGIPDFRGPNGVWTRNPGAEKRSTIQHYVADPEVRRQAWQIRLESEMWQARPNAGHLALSELHAQGRLHTLVTQNIDGLHVEAGVPEAKVVEVHGTVHRYECVDCGARARWATPWHGCGRGRTTRPARSAAASSSRPP